MGKLYSFIYPDIPPNLKDILFHDDKQMIVVGVLGKSQQSDCNKMSGFEVLNEFPSLAPRSTTVDSVDTSLLDQPADGQISFYFERSGNILYMHFVTLYDTAIALRLAKNLHAADPSQGIIALNSSARQSFAQALLLAIQTCHIVVLVETGRVFDSSYLAMFKALKNVRDRFVIPSLPKLLKGTPAAPFMGKDARLCSPRFMFFFEQCLHDLDNDEALNKLEFDTEDKIYKLLRNEYIITNNSANSLFSIPRNKRFVYINADADLIKDPLTESIDTLLKFLQNSSSNNGNKSEVQRNDEAVHDSLDNIRPFTGFAKPLKMYPKEPEESIGTPLQVTKHSFVDLLRQHVAEAMANGFDDSIAKFKGKSQFIVPSAQSWFETFDLMHAISTGNWKAKAIGHDPLKIEEYRAFHTAYMEHITKYLDTDDRFFVECTEYGYEMAIDTYMDLLPNNYSDQFHAQRIAQATAVLCKFSRMPSICDEYVMRLRQKCDDIWKNGRQQCGFASLRGNLCVLAKHGEALDQHSSGVVLVSTCNCGRMQGRRDDPYSVREANYDFYQILAGNCATCSKVAGVSFDVFEPSIKDFRAAEVDHSTNAPEESIENAMTAMMKIMRSAGFNDVVSPIAGKSMLANDMAASQQSQTNLSLNSISIDDMAIKNNVNADAKPQNSGDSSDAESVDEFVIKLKDANNSCGNLNEANAVATMRQVSTTEYLRGMVTTTCPLGVLPQFPSWSLLCIGPSSIYSHNNGLPEHAQSGFISGSNFLLPWDVHVRLEHAASWAASYEKTRSRKKVSSKQRVAAAAAAANTSVATAGQVFTLKIFIGCEYECPRGHRFILNSPDQVLRGGLGIVRDSGSLVVYNDMPLYFPCPCRTGDPRVAQMMRVHIVTPKAPVDVLIDPKVQIGNQIFVTGFAEPAKLSQSAYWILRLPFIYHGDEAPLTPPDTVDAKTAIQHGCLQGAMYGVSETNSSHINN